MCTKYSVPGCVCGTPSCGAHGGVCGQGRGSPGRSGTVGGSEVQVEGSAETSGSCHTLCMHQMKTAVWIIEGREEDKYT